MRKRVMLKGVIYTLVIVSLFFISLETIQRIRYFLRYRSTYWLLFGFAGKPVNYEQVHRGRLPESHKDIENIEVFTIDYGDYRKHNPKFLTKDSKINSFGFRGDEFDIEKEDGTYRIVALGGSTTFGLNVKDSFTYPDFLEKILNQRSDKRYEVINAGVSGNQLRECVDLFKKEIAPLAPDMIIVSSLFNTLYYSSNTHKFSNNFMHRINWFLLDHSLFYLTLREKITYALNKPVLDIYKTNLHNMLNNFLEDDLFWIDLKKDYIAIVEYARNRNIKVVIIKQPVWLRDYKKNKCRILLDKEFLPVYKKGYAVLDEVAAEETAYIVDAPSYFSRLRKKDEFFTDGLHLTEKGNEYIAGLVADRIVELEI